MIKIETVGKTGQRIDHGQLNDLLVEKHIAGDNTGKHPDGRQDRHIHVGKACLRIRVIIM